MSGTNLDLYYLGLDRKRAHFEQGAGREQRHSIGARLWAHRQAWDEDVEATYQWGSFAVGGIQAWAVASEIGYSKPSRPLKPRVALEVNVESGVNKTLSIFPNVGPVRL